MDETLSWRARLAKSNINILGIDGDKWYYEFMYHPRPGQTKWCKTYFDIPQDIKHNPDDPIKWEKVEKTPDEIATLLSKEVLKLRKELEG